MAKIGLSGGEKLEAKLKEIAARVGRKAELRVGFLGDDGGEANGTSTPTVAAIQEFGAPSAGIPPRPFFRPMIKENSGSWGRILGIGLTADDYDVVAALNNLGEDIEAELRKSIIELTEPQLSQVTLLLRQRFGNDPGGITFKDVQKAREDIASGKVPNVTATQAHPLIWTGHMLDSIAHEVEK